MKRIQLELGGKNPLIVCADIATPGAKLNIDKAATQALSLDTHVPAYFFLKVYLSPSNKK